MAKKKEGIYSPAEVGKPEQITKFYYEGGFTSVPKRFEKDCQEMADDGWRLFYAAPLGHTHIGHAESIVAIYQK